MMDKPLVSCLCVSSNRPPYLKRAIAHYANQTYPNREMVVVSEKFSQDYQEIIEAAVSSGQLIRYYWMNEDEKVSLGRLRNYSIEKANGGFICTWDDDDWYHYKRIELQVEATLKSQKNGCIMPFYILYDSVHKEAYMSVPIPHPVTIFCRKDSITSDINYRDLNKAEDTYLIHNLNQRNTFVPLVNPSLYIYVYHSKNSWDLSHFKQFCGKKFSEKASKIISQAVEGIIGNSPDSDLMNVPEIMMEFDYFNQGRR